MSDSSSLTPKTPFVRKTGLSPREQKLQAMREKLANSTSDTATAHGASAGGFSAKNSVPRKSAFQRKAT